MSRTRVSFSSCVPTFINPFLERALSSLSSFSKSLISSKILIVNALSTVASILAVAGCWMVAGSGTGPGYDGVVFADLDVGTGSSPLPGGVSP